MKIVKVTIAILLFCSLILIANADELTPMVFQYLNPEITIEFLNPLEMSSERQQKIADEIAGVSSGASFINGGESPNNIICTLFGHDIAPQSTVTATHHKVDKYNPRCLMEVYHVTYCKRCDYTVTEMVNDFFIVCCPED